MKRDLTKEEIIEFAHRPGAKAIIVENFLLTVNDHWSLHTAQSILEYDARVFGWNDETVSAIADGIIRIYSP